MRQPKIGRCPAVGDTIGDGDRKGVVVSVDFAFVRVRWDDGDEDDIPISELREPE